MNFSGKVFQELVTEFRLPDNMIYLRNNAQEDFFKHKDSFLKKLTEEQQEDFNELSRKALLVIFMS